MLMNQHVGAQYILCRHPIVKWGDTQILCDLPDFLGHISFYLFSFIYEKFARTDRLASDCWRVCVTCCRFYSGYKEAATGENIYHMKMISLFSFCRSFVCILCESS